MSTLSLSIPSMSWVLYLSFFSINSLSTELIENGDPCLRQSMHFFLMFCCSKLTQILRLFKKSFYCLYLCVQWGGMHACECALQVAGSVEERGQLTGVPSLLLAVGPRAWTQIVRLGGTYCHPLSHLTSQIHNFIFSKGKANQWPFLPNTAVPKSCYHDL